MSEQDDSDKLTDRQNDLIGFSLVSLWSMVLREKIREFGGPFKFTIDEIELLMHDLGLDDDMIMESKLDIIKGRL